MPAPTKLRLKRLIHVMPSFIAEALREHNLMAAYRSRPPYQQNDYVGWIARAKLEPTKHKRLNQMLAELKGGKLYMNMPYRPKSKPRRDIALSGGDSETECRDASVAERPVGD